MGKRGHVSLIEVTPGFESIRRTVAQSLGKRGLTIVGSSSGLLLRIQEAFVGDAEFADLRASGMLDMITVSQLVSKLCTAALVPTMQTLDLDRQAALIGLISQRLPEDSAFAGSKHLPGFYKAAASSLQEMRHERVRIDSIAMPEGKLRDVAFLQEGLRDELERRSYGTLSDRIEDLVAAKTPKLQDVRNVLWLPEREWPELWLELLDWLQRAGVAVDLLVEAHPSKPSLFKAKRVLQGRFPDAPVRRVDTDLTPGARLYAENDGQAFSGELRIVEASDEFIEVEWTLRECRRRIRNEGLDAKDIVIFARSLETYGPLLRAAADREGLPIAVDYGESLTAHPFARYVLGALQSMLKSDAASIVGLIRSDYSQVPREQRAKVETAIRALACEEDIWKAVGAAAKAADLPAWLAAVANWRRIALDGQRKPADWLRGIDQLVAGAPWLASCTPREESASDRLIRSLHIALLSLEPHAGLTLREFVAFAERTWTTAEYRVRTQGGIRVVADPQLIGGAKAVMAVGVVEGRFPSRRAEDPILLDRDRAALEAIDARWHLASSYERAEEDDRDFYRLLCSCGDLTLSFPASIGENPQDRAADLWGLSVLPGVRSEVVTFAQRFPKADDCITERELVAAGTWHEDFGSSPAESTVRRVKALLAAHQASRNTELSDDILKAKLGILPRPLRMSHLRSLSQCPFQYFARHRLGIRSVKGDPMNRVIVNSIRRANFHLDNEHDFCASLLSGLTAELATLQGVLNEHELQVLRCTAPTTLNQFAKLEFAARQQWKLKPHSVAPEDDQTGLRRTAKVGDAQVMLSPAIDVLYKREGTDDLVPMRIGWESDEDQTKLECYLVMMMHPGEAKYLVFDSYNHSRRKFFARRTDERKESPGSKGNLSVDIGPQNLKELQREVTSWMQTQIDIARSGVPVARPNVKHCGRCDLGSLCRAAPFADPAVDWTVTGEDSEA